MKDCKDIESQLLAYQQGELSKAEAWEVSLHLEECESCRKVLQEYDQMDKAFENLPKSPAPTTIRMEFEAELQKEKEKLVPKAARVFSFKPWMQVAAALLILLSGIGMGTQLNRNSSTDEIASLKQDMEQMKQILLTDMLRDESPSRRIQAVNQVEQLPQNELDVVLALIHLLRDDPNANVRLSAIQALSQMEESEEARKALIAALSYEDDPLIQVALIHTVVNWEEKDAIESLESLADDDQANELVRDQAQRGLNMLM